MATGGDPEERERTGESDGDATGDDAAGDAGEGTPGAAAGDLGFHSLTDEVAVEVPVEGRLPDWLSGSLVRNGPGAFELPGAGPGGAVDHWFDGLAMLHRFTFPGGGDAGGAGAGGTGSTGTGDAGSEGRTVEYRNRFLRTDAHDRARRGEAGGGFATGSSGLLARLKTLLFEDGYDNTNVVAERFGDRYLALTETPRRVEFDPATLETVGHVEYDGPAPSGYVTCAHLRRDPRTDRLVGFDTDFGRRNRYHVHSTGAPGDRRHVGSVETGDPSYMHSFALTPNYVVLTEFPFVVDPLDFLKPGSQGAFVDNFRWEPDRGTRFVVLDRASGEVVADPVADAFFGFHHANAFERGGGPVGGGGAANGDDARGGDGANGARDAGSAPELVIDLETVPDADGIESLYLEDLRAGELDVLAGRMERFRIDLAARKPTVERETVYPDGTALPTVSPARWCREHRYVYAQSTDQPMHEWPRRLVKLDMETGEAVEFEADGHCSEPVFVPRTGRGWGHDAPGPGAGGADWTADPAPEDEDDGVVLTVVLRPDAGRSDLVVLDATDMTERARVRLPHAVPFDFHGRFFPELT